MDDQTDSHLRDYAERRSDDAFAALVRRHIDLVHSAALRMVSRQGCSSGEAYVGFLDQWITGLLDLIRRRAPAATVREHGGRSDAP